MLDIYRKEHNVKIKEHIFLIVSTNNLKMGWNNELTFENTFMLLLYLFVAYLAKKDMDIVLLY